MRAIVSKAAWFLGIREEKLLNYLLVIVLAMANGFILGWCDGWDSFKKKAIEANAGEYYADANGNAQFRFKEKEARR